MPLVLCFTCNEPKTRNHRTHEWEHIRGDSLCDDADIPFPVTLPRDAS